MIIRNPAQEAAWSIGYALFYVLAAVATGLLIRSRPLPLLGAADFSQDFWYVIPFKIGLLLVVPVVAFLMHGDRLSALLPGWKAKSTTNSQDLSGLHSGGRRQLHPRQGHRRRLP